MVKYKVTITRIERDSFIVEADNSNAAGVKALDKAKESQWSGESLDYEVNQIDMQGPDFDRKQANAEGWDIFISQGSEGGPFQLQKLDSEGKFKTDPDAMRYVMKRAMEGSVYHIDALKQLFEFNPKEKEFALDCVMGKEACKPHIQDEPL